MRKKILCIILKIYIYIEESQLVLTEEAKHSAIFFLKEFTKSHPKGSNTKSGRDELAILRDTGC